MNPQSLAASLLPAVMALLTPAVAAAQPSKDSRSCAKPHVEVVSGGESATLALTTCDGAPSAGVLDKLSALARPAPAEGRTHGSEAPRLSPALIERLEQIVEHFAKAGKAPGDVSARVVLVNGGRSRKGGSLHAEGRALDLHVEGVSNEDLFAFCKTLPDTGCGFYPNDVFVHVDARDDGAGHVAWTDKSQAEPAAPAPVPASSPAAAPARAALPKPEPRERLAGPAEGKAAAEKPAPSAAPVAAAAISLAQPVEPEPAPAAAAPDPAPKAAPALPTLPAPADAPKTHRRSRKGHARHHSL